MSRLAAELSALVEDELRAFNLERIYAGEKGASPASIVEAARTLPMMGDRRVVVVLRAERILKPKRRGKAGRRRRGRRRRSRRAISTCWRRTCESPEPLTTLVLVAADVDRTRQLYKALQQARDDRRVLGAERPAGTRSVDLRQVARTAEALVKQAVADAGQQIEPAAARLVAERAGTDIATLRGDIERLLLYAAGKPKIDLTDAQEVVSAETAQDDWAVTNAIQRGDTAEALRQLGARARVGRRAVS